MEIFIGTSGWVYEDWGGKFYPEKVENKLKYYSQFFNTVEINSSFYRLPKNKAFRKWYEETPENFLFSVKMNQMVTHRKKLIIDDISKRIMEIFFEGCQELKEKLRLVLVQLPPNFKFNAERLESFFGYLEDKKNKLEYFPQFAFEFRDESWFNEATYDILRKHRSALVIAHSINTVSPKFFTADFSYIRFHGPEKLDYSEKELKKWSAFILNSKKIKNFFIYFDNDRNAYAVKNAIILKRITR